MKLFFVAISLIFAASLSVSAQSSKSSGEGLPSATVSAPVKAAKVAAVSAAKYGATMPIRETARSGRTVLHASGCAGQATGNFTVASAKFAAATPKRALRVLRYPLRFFGEK